jgi:cobalt-precorrin 5A hydrolase
MSTAIVTFCEQGACVAERLAEGLGKSQLYVHRSVKRKLVAKRFSSIMSLAGKLFAKHPKIVFIAPCGLAVRAIAPHLQHKTTDPAVVVMDVGARYAVSLLSGHEGGANQLALRVSNAVAAEPVISTTTEAAKDLIVGVGRRRGVDAATVVSAVRQALRLAKANVKQVRMLASASIKSHEPGLLQAAKKLGLGLRFLSAEEICGTAKQFRHSEFVARKVNLPAVAEPSALLAGRRTQLILPKTVFNQVTVAIARENCSW